MSGGKFDTITLKEAIVDKLNDIDLALSIIEEKQMDTNYKISEMKMKQNEINRQQVDIQQNLIMIDKKQLEIDHHHNDIKKALTILLAQQESEDPMNQMQANLIKRSSSIQTVVKSNIKQRNDNNDHNDNSTANSGGYLDDLVQGLWQKIQGSTSDSEESGDTLPTTTTDGSV